jgi:hypothetical protein
MLDPFLQELPDKKQRQTKASNEDFSVEMYGHSLDTSKPHPSVGLWVGRLLIRMGERLAKQDTDLHTIKGHS